MNSHIKSDELYSRGYHRLAGGFQTLSKNPNRYPLGIAPKFLDRGEGAYVWDVDGNRYIDLVAGLGPILLGHCDPGVNCAVADQIKKGASFTLGNALEVEVAELLHSLVPSAESVRFGKNGADATNAAARLARYETSAPHMIFCGYHGLHDSYIATTNNNGGILQEISQYNHQIKWGDYEQLRSVVHCVNSPDGGIRSGLAGIMVEVPPPVYGDDLCEKSYSEYLWTLRDMAHKYGALFILDEVVTGFRKHPGGAQAYYHVDPDLSCFSKGMGNGYSIAAVAGNRKIMQHFENGKVFMSTTFGGETIGLAAASVVLSAMIFTDAFERLQRHGSRLVQRLHGLIEAGIFPATLIGDHSRMLVKFVDVPGIATSDELKTLWQQEMVKRGVLAGGPIFPMVAYTDEIVNKIIEAAGETVAVIKTALRDNAVRERLECPVISDVFGDRYSSAHKVRMVW